MVDSRHDSTKREVIQLAACKSAVAKQGWKMTTGAIELPVPPPVSRPDIDVRFAKCGPALPTTLTRVCSNGGLFPLLLRPDAELDHRTFGPRCDRGVAPAPPPLPARVIGKEVPRNPDAPDDGNAADDRKHNGIAQIHGELFNAQRHDVKQCQKFYLLP